MAVPIGCRRCAACGDVKPLKSFAMKPDGIHHRGVCKTCAPPVPDQTRQRMCASKVRYATQGKALGVAQNAAKRTTFLRVYRCPMCKGWHLTHRPAKEDA